MSIATSLEASATRLRELYKRGNGDLEIFLPNILNDIAFDVERVRGLENVAVINTDLLREYQEKGGIHDGANG